MHLRALPHRRQTRTRDQQLVPHARHKALRKLVSQGLAGSAAEQGHGLMASNEWEKCVARLGSTVH